MLLSLVSFTIAATLIVLLPGPDTLVVVRSLVRGGRRDGLRTVLGVLCGLLCWVVTAALGLSAVLRASEDAYLALRIAGGGLPGLAGRQLAALTRERPRGSARPDRAWLLGRPGH